MSIAKTKTRIKIVTDHRSVITETPDYKLMFLYCTHIPTFTFTKFIVKNVFIYLIEWLLLIK